MRVAIVHDWLVGMRGGERCLELLCERFPDAHLYTAFYRSDRLSPRLRDHRTFVSCLQDIPGSLSYYRHLLPLYPLAARSIERAIARQAEIAPYDLMISVSHCLAKNVRPPEGVPHVCYCLTPVRYLWDHYDTYFEGRLYEPLVRLVSGPLRQWDLRGTASVDLFVGISGYIRDRIRRIYGREADVVYPPVRTDWIAPRTSTTPTNGFLCVSALVPYKNVDLIIRTCNQLQLPLTVVGDGPERDALHQLAGPTVTFRSQVTDEQLAELYRTSRALLFAAEEDFGMVPVEMQAAGRPVICFGRGGATETVQADGKAPTGVYFTELTQESLAEAIAVFTNRQDEFTVDNCRRKAAEFSVSRFHHDLSRALARKGLYVPDDAAGIHSIPLRPAEVVAGGA